MNADLLRSATALALEGKVPCYAAKSLSHSLSDKKARIQTLSKPSSEGH